MTAITPNQYCSLCHGEETPMTPLHVKGIPHFIHPNCLETIRPNWNGRCLRCPEIADEKVFTIWQRTHQVASNHSCAIAIAWAKSDEERRTLLRGMNSEQEADVRGRAIHEAATHRKIDALRFLIPTADDRYDLIYAMIHGAKHNLASDLFGYLNLDQNTQDSLYDRAVLFTGWGIENLLPLLQNAPRNKVVLYSKAIAFAKTNSDRQAILATIKDPEQRQIIRAEAIKEANKQGLKGVVDYLTQ